VDVFMSFCIKKTNYTKTSGSSFTGFISFYYPNNLQYMDWKFSCNSIFAVR